MAFRNLYIPFWLNLYSMLECKIAQDLPLHSILVKSIRCNMTTERLSELPLHSILVKSIPEPIVVDIGWDRPLHSILVKSILCLLLYS